MLSLANKYYQEEYNSMFPTANNDDISKQIKPIKPIKPTEVIPKQQVEVNTDSFNGITIDPPILNAIIQSTMLK